MQRMNAIFLTLSALGLGMVVTSLISGCQPTAQDDAASPAVTTRRKRNRPPTHLPKRNRPPTHLPKRNRPPTGYRPPTIIHRKIKLPVTGHSGVAPRYVITFLLERTFQRHGTWVKSTARRMNGSRTKPSMSNGFPVLVAKPMATRS